MTRLLILLPYAIPPIANGLIWSFMYSFQFGFLNRILFTLGVIDAPINWAGNPDTALYAVTVPYIWRTLPFAILLAYWAAQSRTRGSVAFRKPTRGIASALASSSVPPSTCVNAPTRSL